MDFVTVSTRYRVVIPLKIRKILGIEPGQKLRMIAYENQVTLILVRPVKEARASLKGIDPTIEREEADR